MNKEKYICLNCGKETGNGMFCIECEDRNYYMCEVCGTPRNTKMYPVDGRCVCNECFEKKIK